MGAEAEIELDVLSQWAERRALQLATTSFEKPLAVCAQIAKADVKQHFQDSRAPDGSTWAPLKRLRGGKRHKKSTPKPLLDSGLLAASMAARGEGHVEEITAVSLTVGSNLDRAAPQNFGAPWKGIPAREFAGLSEHAQEQCDEVLADFLAEQMGE